MDADGSQLVLGARVSTNASDRRELVADVDAVPASVGTVKGVLADNGCATGDEVSQLEQRGMEVLVATTAEWRRRHDFRPPLTTAPRRRHMPGRETSARMTCAAALKPRSTKNSFARVVREFANPHRIRQALIRDVLHCPLLNGRTAVGQSTPAMDKPALLLGGDPCLWI